MKNKFLLLIIALVLTACSSREELEIKEEFKPYVDSFLNYAKENGYDWYDQELVIKFANLDGNKAGVCYTKRYPIYIEIDREHWSNLTGPYEKALKEDIIFHEMAHGYPLKRLHDNTTFATGDWKTLMRGDELPNGRNSNANFRGFRRDYYIKELFNPDIEKPEWADFVPDFSDIDETTVLHATPTENTKAWWGGNRTGFESKLTSTGYEFTNSTDENVFVPILYTGVDVVKDDFYVEAQIKITSENPASLSGIGFGDISGDTGSAHYFIISNTGHSNIGEFLCKAPFITLYHENITDDFNKIAIRKKGNFMYFYINDTFAYYNDIDDLPLAGKNFMLISSANTTLTVKYFDVKANINKRTLGDTDNLDIKKFYFIEPKGF